MARLLHTAHDAFRKESVWYLVHVLETTSHNAEMASRLPIVCRVPSYVRHRVLIAAVLMITGFPSQRRCTIEG